MKTKKQNTNKKFDCYAKAYHKTVSGDEFLKVIKNYSHIRVGVSGGEPPFDKTYFRTTKKEVNEILEFGKHQVTYTIMETPPELRNQYEDIVFVHSICMTQY